MKHYFLYVLLILLVSCSKEITTPRTLDIELTSNVQGELIAGQSSVLFESRFLADRQRIPSPDNTIQLYSLFLGLETAISTNFSTNVPGLYTVKAKWGTLESNTLTLDMKSPIKRLTLEQKSTSSSIYSNTFASLNFILTAYDAQGRVISLTPDVKIIGENKILAPNESFTGFITSNSLTFQAKGYGIESNILTIPVLSDEVFPLVRIPVVFHVDSDYFPTYTKEKLQQLINEVNLIYKDQWRTSYPKAEQHANMYVEFYLAEKSPTGELLDVPGRNKISLNRTFSYASYADIKALDDIGWTNFWNFNSYLNILVVNFTDNVSFSYYPYWSIDLQTGISIPKPSRPNSAYGVYFSHTHTSATLAHELGHSLGLRHVFAGGYPTYQSCSSSDPDLCADTPYYDRTEYEKKYTTLLYNRTSCEGKPFIASNIMDYYYSHDNSLTRDQRKRVRHTLNYAYFFPSKFNNPNLKIERGQEKNQKPENYVFTPPDICVFGQ